MVYIDLEPIILNTLKRSTDTFEYLPIFVMLLTKYKIIISWQTYFGWINWICESALSRKDWNHQKH